MSIDLHFKNGTADANTPPHIIERVKTVLGAIELDPASNDAAQQYIQAERYYTAERSAFAQGASWRAKTLFCNPPYSLLVPGNVKPTSASGKWIAPILHGYNQHAIGSAILLVAARVDTKWFAPLWGLPMAFVRGRLKFSSADSAPFPSVLVYLPPDALGATQRFYAAFEDIAECGIFFR